MTVELDVLLMTVKFDGRVVDVDENVLLIARVTEVHVKKELVAGLERFIRDITLEAAQGRKAWQLFESAGQHVTGIGGQLLKIVEIFSAGDQGQQPQLEKLGRRVADLAGLTALGQCRIETLVQGVKHAAAPKIFNTGTQPTHRGDLGAFMEFNTAAKSVTDVGRIHTKTFLLVV